MDMYVYLMDGLDITKFDYRTLFDNSAIKNISHTKMVNKIFAIGNISHVDKLLKA